METYRVVPLLLDSSVNSNYCIAIAFAASLQLKGYASDLLVHRCRGMPLPCKLQMLETATNIMISDLAHTTEIYIIPALLNDYPIERDE